MSERLLILSDLHLGRSRGAATGADALRPLWQGAERLLINGDAAEIHHPRHRTIAAREMLRLFDLCERDGVTLTLLSGNHDPFISDQRHAELAGRRVFVTHGDLLHPAVAPWSPASARMRRAHRSALAALAPESRDDLLARLAASQHASFAEWTDTEALEEEASHSSLLGMMLRPWTLLQVLHYWHVIPALAERFAAEHAPEARYLVIGHTHHPGIWHVRGRVIVNTGSFGFPGRPWAVHLEDGVLTVRRIVRAGGRYGYRRRPVRVFELTRDDEAVAA